MLCSVAALAKQASRLLFRLLRRAFFPPHLMPAQVLPIVSRQKDLFSGEHLFSHGQAQNDHVYTRVYVIERFVRSQALSPQPPFRMSGVEKASTLQTHNTSCSLFPEDPASFH